MRVGFGYDSHRLEPDRSLFIGGIRIPHDKGLKGHSDGDVLIHAIIDAILGAAGLGDIGTHFPDTDPKFKDARSAELLRQVIELVRQKGLRVASVDSTVVAEAPRLAPFIGDMIKTLSAILGTEAVSVKAKTNEKMGFTGRGEGMAAFAVCLLSEI